MLEGDPHLNLKSWALKFWHGVLSINMRNISEATNEKIEMKSWSDTKLQHKQDDDITSG